MDPRDAYWLTGSPATISTAGLAAIGADLAVIQFIHPSWGIYAGYSIRGVVGCAILVYLFLSRRSMPSDFGMSITGWRGDFRLMVRMGFIVLGIWLLLFAAAVIAVRAGGAKLSDVWLGGDFRTMDQFGQFVLNALICAPIVEELIYRGFAIPALAVGFGRRWAVFLSGPVFYLLHLSYGYDWKLLHYNVAGWILGWAYVRTGRLWVPIVLHLLGNVLMGLDDALLLFAPGLGKAIFGI